MPDSVSKPVVLPSIGLLGELELEDLHLLSSSGRGWNVESGLKVISEGDQQDCLYIVIKGKLDVSKQGEDGLLSVAELNVGDAFGEMNFLDRESASATVTAKQDSTIWRMSRNEFYGFTDAHPQVAMQLFRALAVLVVGRLRHMLEEQGGQASGSVRDTKKRWWF
jgi:CRP/FNR family cyclic AMP-dependent transcriptional regulator